MWNQWNMCFVFLTKNNWRTKLHNDGKRSSGCECCSHPFHKNGWFGPVCSWWWMVMDGYVNVITCHNKKLTNFIVKLVKMEGWWWLMVYTPRLMVTPLKLLPALPRSVTPEHRHCRTTVPSNNKLSVSFHVPVVFQRNGVAIISFFFLSYFFINFCEAQARVRQG